MQIPIADLEGIERREAGLILGRKGAIAVALLDRPQRGNAFDMALLNALAAMWQELEQDSSVRCIVLGTTSQRFFCTGRDLKEAAEDGNLGPEQPYEKEVKFTSRLACVTKPVICAIEGKTVGGGLDFLLDADIAIAGESATFNDPHVSVGFVSAREGLGLSLKTGIGNALYLSLVGRGTHWNAQRALALGLLQEVVPDGTALERSIALAGEIVKNSPSAMARTKQAIWSLPDIGSYDQAMRHAWLLLQRQRHHRDSVEGPLAFAEGRQPNWTGDN